MVITNQVIWDNGLMWLIRLQEDGFGTLAAGATAGSSLTAFAKAGTYLAHWTFWSNGVDNGGCSVEARNVDESDLVFGQTLTQVRIQIQNVSPNSATTCLGGVLVLMKNTGRR